MTVTACCGHIRKAEAPVTLAIAKSHMWPTSALARGEGLCLQDGHTRYENLWSVSSGRGEGENSEGETARKDSSSESGCSWLILCGAVDRWCCHGKKYCNVNDVCSPSRCCSVLPGGGRVLSTSSSLKSKQGGWSPYHLSGNLPVVRAEKWDHTNHIFVVKDFPAGEWHTAFLLSFFGQKKSHTMSNFKGLGKWNPTMCLEEGEGRDPQMKIWLPLFICL